MVAKEAMIHEFRRTNDPGLLAQQFYALHLTRQGVPSDEVVRQVLLKRREWSRLRQAGTQADWSSSEYGKTIVRLVGRAVTQYFGAGGTGVEGANLAILTYEDMVRGDRVSLAARRVTTQFADWQDRVASPEETFFEYQQRRYATDEQFAANVWDPLFLNAYGFRPTSDDATVLDNYPEFARHESLRSVLSSQQNAEALLGIVTEVQRANLQELRETRRTVEDVRGVLAVNTNVQRETWALLARAEYRQERARRAALEDAGRRATAGLAVHLIGALDPDLAAQARAVSQGVFRVREATAQYAAAAAELGAGSFAAQMILANGYVAAAFMVMNALAETGPSVDDLILQQVGALRQEVATLRSEMHERFDDVFRVMLGGFDTLRAGDARILEGLDGVRVELRSARIQLGEVAGMQMELPLLLERTRSFPR